MDVHDEKFGNLIYIRRQYLVPIWQREYSWQRDEWEELWNDITRLYEERSREDASDVTHFMGSIVLKPRELGGVEKYILIDGQQRLTTLLVVLVLIRDKARKDGNVLSNVIQESYLLNRDIKTSDERFKLKPSEVDRLIFEKIMNGDLDAGMRLLAGAHNFFRYKLEEARDKNGNKYDLEKLKESIIDGLRMVEIILSPRDDPNRIFETLNYRGRELEQADLVRNYFMMKIRDENKAERLYRGTWIPMQQNVADIYNLTQFFRHYLSMEKQKRVKKNKIFPLVQERLKWLSEEQTASELRRMKTHSEYYQCLLFPEKESNLKMRKRLERLNRWRVSVAYPLLLKAYRAKTSEDDFCRLLQIIESFLVRRHFCDVKTNSLNTIFSEKLCALDENNLVNSVKKTLAEFRWNYRWPSDEEFAEKFTTFPIYKDRTKCLLILSSLEESFGHPEKVQLENLTIEHVMPRTLSDWWKTHLGADWQRTHAELVDTIGNLTLVAQPVNPSLSNASFPDKKAWFEKTKVDLSTYFRTTDKWTRTEILKRAKELSSRALKIWPRVL